MLVLGLTQLGANLPHYRREALIQRIAENPPPFRFSLLDPCRDTLLQIELGPLKAFQTRLQSGVLECSESFHDFSPHPWRTAQLPGAQIYESGVIFPVLRLALVRNAYMSAAVAETATTTATGVPRYFMPCMKSSSSGTMTRLSSNVAF
jgi:hypothetical protein